MDGKVQEVIPSDDRRISNQETTLHSEGLARQHLRLAITHLVQNKSPEPFAFYKSELKPSIQAFNPALYAKVMQSRLKRMYGVVKRVNKAGQRQLQRDADSDISFFDNDCLLFYLLKYSEKFGVDSLVFFASTDRTMSYD